MTRTVLLTATLMTLAAMMLPPAADANPPAYFGPMNNVYGVTVPAQKFRVGLRAAYNTTGSFVAPMLGVQYGLTDKLEAGLTSGMAVGGLGTATVAGSVDTVSTWLKYQFIPTGPVTVSMLAGGTFPMTAGGMASGGLTGIVGFPNPVVNVTLNAGFGPNYRWTPATYVVGQGYTFNVGLDRSLTPLLTLIGEGFIAGNLGVAPGFGERVGLLAHWSPDLFSDLSIRATQDTGTGVAVYSPTLGTTWTF
ncbi:MAG: hypothetical protein H7338_14525 [Candidatus Sericytochromatia bacterium]|nr:hypothetical protein [Candidatus Sericytochromatia bacterium]